MPLWLAFTSLPLVSGLLVGCIVAALHRWRTASQANAPLYAPPAAAWLILGWPLLDLIHALTGPFPALAWNRCGVDAAMAMACLFMAGGSWRRPPLYILGSMAGGGLMLATSGQILWGSPDLITGHVNHALAVLSPGIMGWFIFSLLCRRWLGWMIPTALLVLLCIWNLWAIPGFPRRGASLAILAGLGSAGITLLHHRHRLLANGLMILGVTAGSLWAWHQFDAGMNLERNLRPLHWRAALDGIIAWFPSGGGPWAALRLPSLESESARIALMCGEAVDHVHNEPLSIALEYGAPGIILGFLQAFAIGHHAINVSNLRRRAATVALLGALGIFLLVDNAFGLPIGRIGLGIILGASLAVHSRPLTQPNSRVRSLWRWIPLPLIGAMLITLSMELPVWMTPSDGGPSRYKSALAHTGIPQVGIALLDLSAASPVPNMGGMGEEITAIAWNRIGPADPIVDYRLGTLGFLGKTSILTTSSRYHLDPGSMQEFTAERPRLLLAWWSTATIAAHYWPLRTKPYLDLIWLMDHGYQEKLSDRLYRRLRWWRGDTQAEIPQFSRMSLNEIEDAADHLAACHWWAATNQRCTPEFHHSLAQLVAHWSLGIHHAKPFIYAMEHDPQQASSWFWPHVNGISYIFESNNTTPLASELSMIHSPITARMALAALASIPDRESVRHVQGWLEPAIEISPTNTAPAYTRALVRLQRLSSIYLPGASSIPTPP